MAEHNEVDQILTDQSVLIAHMLEGIAQLGEVQKLVARSLIDLQMEPKTKLLISANLAAAINGLNRASHLIMRASIEGDDIAPGHDQRNEPH